MSHTAQHRHRRAGEAIGAQCNREEICGILFVKVSTANEDKARGRGGRGDKMQWSGRMD